MKDEKEKQRRVIHTVRISGYFKTPPTEKEIYQALQQFGRIQRVLRWAPILFLGLMIAIIFLAIKLTNVKFPFFILASGSIIIILKEVSTLIFSIQMRKNLMKPIAKLKEAVEELSKGNYGYTIEEDNLSMVGDLISSFNHMSKEIKEANELKKSYEQNRKELIAGISHDLKTPITSIVGYVDAIQSGVATSEEKMKTYLDIIEANAIYTNKLIDDLFLFSKLDINQMKYDFEEMPICEFLKDIIIEKKLELEDQGIEVMYHVDISPELMLPIDSKMVYRIMANILSNAIKYGQEDKPRIAIEAKDIPNGIQVSIEDNGRGIGKENINQIFDVFYREDASRNKKVGGTGLGLAITKQLVQAHGGRIWAESVQGQGTKITFTLQKEFQKEAENAEDTDHRG